MGRTEDALKESEKDLDAAHGKQEPPKMKPRSKPIGGNSGIVSALTNTSYGSFTVDANQEGVARDAVEEAKRESMKNKDFMPSGGSHDPHASLGCGHQDRNHQ